jgi:hypothetical protein
MEGGNIPGSSEEGSDAIAFNGEYIAGVRVARIKMIDRIETSLFSPVVLRCFIPIDPYLKDVSNME